MLKNNAEKKAVVIEAQQPDLFKIPNKVFVFDINNNKDDYSFAFSFIMRKFEDYSNDENAVMPHVKI